ncbi:MAG: tRNA (adenosine(37)-N6)-threonylcarbamoyltransferase complex ATPase subunit type 1 TsaE [Spirochaetia bacterium]|nr:tRNA (adenosine(37)-N6)-threonylcarbamoyltransferase complex ATPase subunit type 1 TsaE [Spirochaetia bacterium]
MAAVKEYISRSPEDTLRIGLETGALLTEGSIISLRGSLGTGKTTFTKGIAQYFTIQEAVTSPSYTIFQEYTGDLTLFHLDLYRIESLEEFELLGVEEYFYDNGITIIEWSELITELLPPSTIFIYFEILENQYRKITITFP